MRRRAKLPRDVTGSNIGLSFLDVLASALGAAVLLFVILQSVATAMLLIVVCGAGEVLYRERLPQHLAIPRVFTPRALASKRVFRVNHNGRRKPITLDEALLLMDKDRDYLVYRDAERESVSILVRRRDGHFDLIEA